MNKWAELIMGLIILVGCIVLAWMSSTYHWTLFGKSLNFLTPAWIVFKGMLFWGIFFIGLLLILLAINSLRD